MRKSIKQPEISTRFILQLQDAATSHGTIFWHVTFCYYLDAVSGALSFDDLSLTEIELNFILLCMNDYVELSVTETI